MAWYLCFTSGVQLKIGSHFYIAFRVNYPAIIWVDCKVFNQPLFCFIKMNTGVVIPDITGKPANIIQQKNK